MSIEEAYNQFLVKVNKNYKSSNVVASKDRFITLYNEEQVRRVEFALENKNDDSIRSIQQFLTTSTPLPATFIQGNKTSVSLPEDYLEFSSAYCTVSAGECDNIRLSLFEIKDFDTEEVLSDVNNSPSLSYREAPFYIGGDAIQVFTEGFTVNTATVTYYRYPRTVDISGYIHLDNTASTNIGPEGDSAFINKVISMCAESFFRNYGDTNQVTINKDRIQNNN